MKFRQKLNFTSKFPTENHFTTLQCKTKSLTRAPTLLHMVWLSNLLNLLLSGTSLPGEIAQVSSRGVIYPGVIVKGVNASGHMYQGEIVPGLMSYTTTPIDISPTAISPRLLRLLQFRLSQFRLERASATSGLPKKMLFTMSRIFSQLFWISLLVLSVSNRFPANVMRDLYRVWQTSRWFLPPATACGANAVTLSFLCDNGGGWC